MAVLAKICGLCFKKPHGLKSWNLKINIMETLGNFFLFFDKSRGSFFKKNREFYMENSCTVLLDKNRGYFKEKSLKKNLTYIGLFL